MATAEIDLIPTHITQVARTTRLSPNYVEITVRGGLDRFVSKGLDDFVYVLLPPAGRSDLTIGVDFRWTAYYEMSDEERPVGAYYTVRRIRPEREEIDIEVFLHEDVGSVSGWAARCGADAPLALWGPRTAWAPPPATDEWFLVADETGLPAVARMIESAPVGLHVRAFVEVPTADDARDLGPDVTWLPRNGRRAGQTTQLLDAVRATKFTGASPYVWGGGESRAMTAIRKLVRNEHGLPREQVSLVAYWRHAAHAADPLDDDD